MVMYAIKPMFQKRQHEAIAEVLRKRKQEIRPPTLKESREGGFSDPRLVELEVLQNRLMQLFAADNPRFNPARFVEACR